MDTYQELVDHLRAELEKVTAERDENKWCKSKLIEMRNERDEANAELENAREDYRALKESYDTACDCAAVYRKQRDAANALLGEAYEQFDEDTSLDLLDRIEKHLGD